MNSLIAGNAKLAFSLVNSIMPKLSVILMKDVMILPNILAASLTDTAVESVYSENLWEESLDLMLNLVTIKDVFE